jgi:hypothetical protein
LQGLNPELPMSALGHKQTFKRLRLMSALPPKADIDFIRAIGGRRVGTVVLSIGRFRFTLWLRPKSPQPPNKQCNYRTNANVREDLLRRLRQVSVNPNK